MAKVGDPVCLSFAFCKKCNKCKTAHPAYCADFVRLNSMGEKGSFDHEDGSKVAGSFFGQSSYSNLTVVKEQSVVNLSGVVKDEE